MFACGNYLITTEITFSHELQTCDWPRNVVCVSGKRNGEIIDANEEDHERVPRLLVEDINFGQKNIIPVSEIQLHVIKDAVKF